jgi:hypothetical protein
MSESIAAQLEAASVELPGRPGRWVRGCVASRILSIRPSNRHQWERPNGARAWGIDVERVHMPGAQTRGGMLVYYALASCLCVADYKATRSRRAWTAWETAELRRLIGHLGYPEIARRLNRGLEGIYAKAHDLRLNHKAVAMRRDRRITTTKLAEWAGVDRSAARRWVAMGREGGRLPATRVVGGHGEYLIDLREFRAWLQHRPRVASGLSARLMDRLGLDVDLDTHRVIDLRPRNCQPQPQPAGASA